MIGFHALHETCEATQDRDIPLIFSVFAAPPRLAPPHCKLLPIAAMRRRLCACVLLLFGTPVALSYHAVDKPCPMGSSGPLAVQPADDGMDNCTEASCRRKVTQRTGTEEAEAAARAEVKEAEEAETAEAKAAEAKAAEVKAAEAEAAEAKTAEVKAAEAKAKAARAKAAEAALAEADEAARPMAEEVNDDAMVPCPTDEPSVRKQVTAAEAAEETTRTLVHAAARNEAQTAARAPAPGYSEEAMNRMMR